MVHLQRTSDEKRPGQGRQRINPREFATTGPKNTGNRSQLPVTPWFASRQQWRAGKAEIRVGNRFYASLCVKSVSDVLFGRVATRYSLLATISPPSATPAGSGRAWTLPRWLMPDTDRGISKDRTGPDLDKRPLYSVCHRTRRFLRTNQSVLPPQVQRSSCRVAFCLGGGRRRRARRRAVRIRPRVQGGGPPSSRLE